jgi:hypothetical protein
MDVPSPLGLRNESAEQKLIVFTGSAGLSPIGGPRPFRPGSYSVDGDIGRLPPRESHDGHFMDHFISPYTGPRRLWEEVKDYVKFVHEQADII